MANRSPDVYHTAWGNYFNDVGVSSFRSDIVWNADQGITTGCGAGRFCPTANVPRDQMASFLSRALHLSGPAPNAYTDDNGNPHEPNINLVAREGIASGCGTNLFCPSGLVKRDQMASFLSRALDLSGAGTERLHRRQRQPPRGQHQPRGPRWHRERLRRHPVLPIGQRHPRPDGGLPPSRLRLTQLPHPRLDGRATAMTRLPMSTASAGVGMSAIIDSPVTAR